MAAESDKMDERARKIYEKYDLNLRMSMSLLGSLRRKLNNYDKLPKYYHKMHHQDNEEDDLLDITKYSYHELFDYFFKREYYTNIMFKVIEDRIDYIDDGMYGVYGNWSNSDLSEGEKSISVYDLRELIYTLEKKIKKLESQIESNSPQKGKEPLTKKKKSNSLSLENSNNSNSLSLENSNNSNLSDFESLDDEEKEVNKNANEKSIKNQLNRTVQKKRKDKVMNNITKKRYELKPKGKTLKKSSPDPFLV